MIFILYKIKYILYF